MKRTLRMAAAVLLFLFLISFSSFAAGKPLPGPSEAGALRVEGTQLLSQDRTLYIVAGRLEQRVTLMLTLSCVVILIILVTVSLIIITKILELYMRSIRRETSCIRLS